MTSTRVSSLRSGGGDVALQTLGLRGQLGHAGEVQGRVDIAVLLVPAGLAGEDALGQGQLGFHCPALRAGLR